MNQIEKLIAELCPTGIVHVKLGEMLQYEQPTKYLVESTEYDDAYNTPVLTAGKSFILGYTEETNGIYLASSNQPVIIFDDFTTAFKWVDFPFKTKSSAMKIVTPRTDIPVNLRYVYHAMQTILYKPQDHARQWIKTYSKFKIPLPPLEIQHAIVGILDKFTELEAELEAELDAELEARKRQYQYYRDGILNFDAHSTSRCKPIEDLIKRFCPDGVEYKAIDDFGKLVRGNGMPKSDFVENGVGCIHYGQIYTHYGIWASETISCVSAEKAKKLAKVDPGDLIVTNTSENIDDVCKAVAWIGESQIVTGGHATVLKHNQDPKYLSYYMQTSNFSIEKKKRAMGTKVMDVSAKNLAKIKIPIPPFEVQQEIVAILDRFDALVNDLSHGLPAEITARRKQYEYYRDRLLTFKEVE